MSMLPTSRRAEQFARLLDGGTTVTDSALAPLVTLAEALRAVPLGPNPDFRAQLRQRLVAVAAVQAPAVPAARPSVGERAREFAGTWRGQRRLAAAAGALAGLVALSGVAVSASRSLPGDPFYSAKRAAESVQLAMTFGDYDRGRRHLEFARTRLNEVQALVSRDTALAPAVPGRPSAAASTFGGDAGRVVDTLQAMDGQTVAGSRDLTTAYRNDHERRALVLLERFARDQRTQLAAMLPALPDAAQAHGRQSLSLLARVDQRASALLIDASCAAACPSTGTGTGSTGTDELGVKPCDCLPAPGVGGSGPGTTVVPPGTTVPGTGPGTGATAPGAPTAPGEPSAPSDGGIGSIIGNVPLPTVTTAPGLPSLSPPPLPGVSATPLPLPTSSGLLPSLPGNVLPSTGTLPLPLPSTSVPLPAVTLPGIG